MLAAAVARERATLPRLHVAGGSRPLAPGYEYTGGMSVPMLSALLPTEMKPAGGLTGGLPSMRGAPDPSKKEKELPSPPNDHPATQEEEKRWKAELEMLQTVIAESQKKNAESQRAAAFGGGGFSGFVQRLHSAETVVIITLTVLWFLSLSLVAAHPMFIGAFIVFFTVWLAELLAAGLRPDPAQLHNAVQTATDWTWLVQTRFPPLSMLIYMVMGIVVSLAAPPCCGGRSCIDASSEDASFSGKCSKADDCADSSDVCVDGKTVTASCSGQDCKCYKSDGKDYRCTKDADCKKDATCSDDGVCEFKCTKPDDCAGASDVCVDDETKKVVASCGSGKCQCIKSDGKDNKCTKDDECKSTATAATANSAATTGATCSKDGVCEAKAVAAKAPDAVKAHFDSRTPASYGCPMEYASQTLYALFLISALR